MIAWRSGLVASDVVSALFVPALAPVKELIDQIGSHFTTAEDKEAAEAKLNNAWADGMRSYTQMLWIGGLKTRAAYPPESPKDDRRVAARWEEYA
ncbi:hypothetical protein BH24ACT15_BH24ACT15_36290 [soil metagenome]